MTKLFLQGGEAGVAGEQGEDDLLELRREMELHRLHSNLDIAELTIADVCPMLFLFTM